MKTLLALFFTFLAIVCAAQNKESYPVTDSMTISGLVVHGATLTAAELQQMGDTAFNTIRILSHTGEYKSTYQQAKAVSLRKLLGKYLSTDIKQKDKNSVYFLFTAADGFRAVYSYHELFESGKPDIFILLAYDKVMLKDMPERLVLLMTSPDGSGKLGMRGIAHVDIRQAR